MMKKTTFIIAIALCLLALCSCSTFMGPGADSFSFVQNSSKVTLSLDAAKAAAADTVEIRSQLLDANGQVMKTACATFPASASVEYDLENFGKHDVIVTYGKNGKKVGTEAFTVVLTAEAYNIAQLNATMPVTYFSLSFADADNAGASNFVDSTLPTIVALERAKAYNWDALLPNMYALPFAAEKDLRSSGTTDSYYITYYRVIRATIEYVEYLHDLNPQSFFNFYLNDIIPAHMFFLVCDTGIGFDNCSVTFITDGSGTYAGVKNAFGDGSADEDDSLALYEEMKAIYKEIKSKAEAGRTLSYYAEIWNRANWKESGDILAMYTYMAVVAEDEDINVKWIVTRKNADTFGSSAVFNEIISPSENVTAIGLNNLWNALEPSEIETFKVLYSLEVPGFQEAVDAGKKVMVFVGTRDDHLEKSGLNVLDCYDFITSYFGDSYDYFYKGHPGDTSNYDGSKAAELNKIGANVLDAGTTCELFELLFGVDFAGYTSSTYQVEEGDVPLICGVGEFGTDSYWPHVQMIMSPKQDDGTYKIIKRDGTSATWTPGSDASALIFN